MLIEKSNIADAACYKWITTPPPDPPEDTPYTSCNYCAGTGEGFIVGMQGDGWTGAPCDMCGGFGTVVVLDGETYELAETGSDGAGLVYRDNLGRYRSIPDTVSA